MRGVSHRGLRPDISRRMIAQLMTADASAILSRLQPGEGRLMPQQMSLRVEGVKAQRHIDGKIHEHGPVGGDRHLSQNALQIWRPQEPLKERQWFSLRMERSSVG
jgi:hypothetical protein